MTIKLTVLLSFNEEWLLEVQQYIIVFLLIIIFIFLLLDLILDLILQHSHHPNQKLWHILLPLQGVPVTLDEGGNKLLLCINGWKRDITFTVKLTFTMVGLNRALTTDLIDFPPRSASSLFETPISWSSKGHLWQGIETWGGKGGGWFSDGWFSGGGLMMSGDEWHWMVWSWVWWFDFSLWVVRRWVRTVRRLFLGMTDENRGEKMDRWQTSWSRRPLNQLRISSESNDPTVDADQGFKLENKEQPSSDKTPEQRWWDDEKHENIVCRCMNRTL